MLFVVIFSIIYMSVFPVSATDYRAQARELVRESQSQRESNLSEAQVFLDNLSTETLTKESSTESEQSPAQTDPWGETPVSEFSESNDQLKTEHRVLENVPDQREGETCCGVPKGLQKKEEPHLDQELVTHGEGELLIFVSFSLPDQALKNLYEESLRLKARLILRGLHENSFQETRKKAQKLGIQADIDPTLFEKYSIKVVPTFVLEKGDQGNKVAGNITAQEALSILQGESE